MGLGHAMYYRKKEKAPDDEWVSSTDPDAYDEQLTADLNDDANPEFKQDAIASVRRNLPELGHMKDQELAQYAQSVKGRRAPAAPTPPVTNASIQQGNAKMAGAKLFETNIKNAAATQNSAMATPGEKAAAQAPIPANITPKDVNNIRVPEFDSSEEMEKYAVDESNRRLAQGLPGVSAVNARQGWGRYAPNIQVQDPQGNTLGQLRPGVPYDRSRVRNMPVVDLDQLTGASDVLQQGAARTLAKGLDWGAPDKPTGYGLRDFGRDAGAMAGKKFPEATRSLAGALSGPLSVAAGAMGTIDKAEEGVFRALSAKTHGRGSSLDNFDPNKGLYQPQDPPAPDAPKSLMERWADENAKESQFYMDAMKQLARLPRDLPHGEDAGEVYGAGMGKSAGEFASQVAPTAGQLVGGVVGKNIILPALKGTVRGSAMVGNAVAPKAMRWISPAPSALELPEELKMLVDTAGAAKRSAGDVMERQDMAAMLEKLREGTNASEPEIEAALKKAIQTWHDPDLRIAAAVENPLVGKMFNDLQPIHQRNVMMSGIEGPYDPFHLQRGQDISKRHVWGENQAAIDATGSEERRQLEDAASVGEIIQPHTLAGVPGITDEMRVGMRPKNDYQEALLGGIQDSGDVLNSMRKKPLEGYAKGLAVPVGADERAVLRNELTGARDEATDAFRQVQREKPGPEVVARRGRSLDDQLRQWREADQGMESGVTKELANFNAAQGLARTARNIAEGKGLGDKAMFQSIMGDMDILRKRGDVADLEEFFGKEATQGAPRVDVNRQVITPGNVQQRASAAKGTNKAGEQYMAWHTVNTDGTYNLTQEAIQKLKQEQKVIITNGGLKLTDNANVTAGGRPVVVHFPNAPDELNGKVMNRAVAQALMEHSDPDGWAKNIQSTAAEIDRALGATQLVSLVTRGNPGFEARNRTNEIIRLTTHDPRWMEEANLRLVEEVSNAPLGRGGRFVPELGMTTGEAHELLARTGALGKGISAEMMDLKHQTHLPDWATPGSPQMLRDAASPLARAIGHATRPAKSVARGGIRLADVAAKPGEAMGKVANEGVKHGLFPGLAKEYGAEDGIRMAGTLNEMRHGVRPSIASATVRNLLIDFGNQAPGQKFLRMAVPFNTYYLGAINGVANLALTQPRRFSRLYDVMRAAENWDTDTRGKGMALNRKFKSSKDAMSGSPLLQNENGDMYVTRIEGLQGEVAGLREIAGNLTGANDTEGNAASILHPGITSAAEFATGKAPTTGRNVFGASADDFDRAVANLHGQGIPVTKPTLAWSLYQIQKNGSLTQPLGASPEAGLAWHLASSAPGVGRATIPAPVGLAYRALQGQPNPASRSPESVDQMLSRAANSYAWGGRQQTISPTQEELRSQREFGALTNPMPEVTQKKAVKGGKVDRAIMDALYKRAMQRSPAGGQQ